MRSRKPNYIFGIRFLFITLDHFVTLRARAARKRVIRRNPVCRSLFAERKALFVSCESQPLKLLWLRWPKLVALRRLVDFASRLKAKYWRGRRSCSRRGNSRKGCSFANSFTLSRSVLINWSDCRFTRGWCISDPLSRSLWYGARYFCCFWPTNDETRWAQRATLLSITVLNLLC